MLLRCLAGTKITLIINIHAVGNGLEASVRGKGFHHLEKFILTVEAPLTVITDVFRPIHFARLDHLNGDPMFLREGEGILQLSARQTGRVCNYRQHVLAQELASDPSKVSRITPPEYAIRGRPSERRESSRRRCLADRIHI